MSATRIVQPRLTVLNPVQVEQVHDYSLKILSTTGIRVESESARKLFAGTIGRQAANGDCVQIPAELVEWALQAAPSKVDVYDRKGTCGPS